MLLSNVNVTGQCHLAAYTSLFLVQFIVPRRRNLIHRCWGVFFCIAQPAATLKGSVERSRPEWYFCSLLPYFLLSSLKIFQLCLTFWTSSFDLVHFKNSFRKKKNIRKTTQNALAPSIFLILSIVLKLGTPLLHTQAQNTLLQNF